MYAVYVAIMPRMMIVNTPGIIPIVCIIPGRLRMPMPTWLVKKMRAVWITCKIRR